MPAVELISSNFSINSDPNGNPFGNAQSIVKLASGGFVVFWSENSLVDGSGGAVLARIYNADGSAAGPQFVVNTTTTGNQALPDAVQLPGGNIMVFWTDTSTLSADNSGSAIIGHIFSATGARIGGEFLVNTVISGTQSQPASTVLNNGNVMVVWSDLGGSDGNASGIKAQILDAAGNKVGTEFLVNTQTVGSQGSATIATLANGNVVVTWQDASALRGDLSGMAIRAQILDQNGAAVGSEFLVNTETANGQNLPQIAALSNGTFVIVWQDSSLIGGDNDSSGIKAQIFDAAGNKIGTEFLVNTTTTGAQTGPAITATADGGFVIVWRDATPTNQINRGQAFDANGVRLGGEFVASAGDGAGQVIGSPMVADIGGNRILVTGTVGEVGNVIVPLGVRGHIFNVLDPAVGTNGNETLFGSADRGDIMLGRDGNDVLVAFAGNDDLQGGNGDDSLYGGTGADLLDGGAGFDYAFYSGAATALVVDLATPALNTGEAAGDTFIAIEGLVGSAFNDTLGGNSDANWIYGGNGQDTILGRSGNDTLIGEAGGDSLFGEVGNDTLVGGDGGDFLDGGEGGDFLSGGSGFDYANYASATAGLVADLSQPSANSGQAAGDTYFDVEGLIGSSFGDLLRGDGGDNWIYGGNGSDVLFGRDGADVLIGNADTDYVYGDAGDDILYGDAGNDHLIGGGGTDILVGGDGFDYAHYGDAFRGVTVDMVNNVDNTGEAFGDFLVGIEAVVGSAFNDSIRGNEEVNWLYGGDGIDYLYGRGGNDYLLGGNGTDFLYGGAGTDLLYGEGGDDRFVFGNGGGIDYIMDFNVAGGDAILIDSAALGLTTFAQVQARMVQSGNDTIIGVNGDSIIVLVGVTPAQLTASEFVFG